MKICLVGTHGIGKTSLAHALVGELKSRGVKAGLVREMVRECPIQTGTEGKNSAEAEAWILCRQVAEEIEGEKNFDVVVCDRGVIDIYAYFLSIKKKFGASECLEKISESIFQTWGKTYDYIFKLPPAFTPADDNFRSTNPEWQIEIDSLVEKNISDLGVDAHTIPLKANNERVNEVLKVVKI